MVAGIGVFEDPHCEVDKCVELRTDYSRMCSTHKNRMKRYGTLEVTCIACGSMFIWMGEKFHGRRRCGSCSSDVLVGGKSRITIRKHHLTVANWNELYAASGGCCALCGFEGELQIDHDHRCCPKADFTCGLCIRGLLCRHCNSMVGHYEKCPGTLRIAQLDEWCNRPYFVFTTPRLGEAA